MEKTYQFVSYLQRIPKPKRQKEIVVITQNWLIKERAKRTFEVFVKDKAWKIQVLMGIEYPMKVLRVTELSANREFQILLNNFT